MTPCETASGLLFLSLSCTRQIINSILPSPSHIHNTLSRTLDFSAMPWLMKAEPEPRVVNGIDVKVDLTIRDSQYPDTS